MFTNQFKGRKGQVINDQYSIIKFICEGGYSMVYLCQDLIKNSTVALKIIKADPKYATAAKNEIDIMKKINKIPSIETKHICMYYNDFIFPALNGFYHTAIVLEPLGMSLYDALNSGCKFSVEDTKKIIKQLIIATQTIHEQLRMIHADIKPSNIMFVGDPKDCNIKLADFGNMLNIKSIIEWEYEDCRKLQTRRYRSPESIIGSRYSEVTDSWSIGCITFELLTGSPLFDPRGIGEGDTIYEEFMPRIIADGDRDFDHLSQMKFMNDDVFSEDIINLSFWRLDFFKGEDNTELIMDTRGVPTINLLEYLLKKHIKDKNEFENIHGFLKYCLFINPRYRLDCPGLLQTEFMTT